MAGAADRIRIAEESYNAVIERTTALDGHISELDRHSSGLERRLRDTETRLEKFSRETDKAVENLRTLRQTLDGEEAASKSRSEQIRDSHSIPTLMYVGVALTAFFSALFGSVVRAWGAWVADILFG